MNAYLGIDVSKGYADFTLLDETKGELEKVFQLDDTRSGHEALKRFFQKKILDYQLSTIYCAVESTGGFENNWYSSLVEMSKTLPVKVARLNPSGVKNNISASLERNVTDAISSEHIARYLIAHPDKVRYEQQNDYYASFRSNHRHIILLKKQKTQLINEMKMILYTSFPELMQYCKTGMPIWILSVLIKFPTVLEIARQSVKGLSRIKHIAPDKAESLISKARASVASRANFSQGFLIKSLAKQILEKQDIIEQHKSYLSEECRGDEVNLLQSIPGIAAYSASALMIEIEDIRRFASPSQLACYFGLHPVFKQSGDKKGAFKMSKKGRPTLRAILYMCSQTAIRNDEHLKSIYHKHRSKGKTHKYAIGVIMHKLMRIIWGVLIRKQSYSTEIDKKNQEKKPLEVTMKSQNAASQKELQAKRRYQELDVAAPITRKQSKTRKVHIKSQVDTVKQVRDH